MRKKLLLLLLHFAATHAFAQPMKYPQTRVGSESDVFFGTTVKDPYRWLESGDSKEVADWIARQNEVTSAYISAIPFRDEIAKRLSVLWNYEKYSAPFQEGNFLYYYKNTGLQNQSVLYRRPFGKNDGEEVFLDPNRFSKDGTVSLAGIEFSPDGSVAAYQTSDGGSDWTTIYVMSTATKALMADTLVDVKFSSVAWKGNEGFYYSSYDRPKTGSQLVAKTDQHKLLYHKLGAAQHSDKLIFGGEKMPRRYVGASVTESGNYLIISAANATYGNELYVQHIAVPGAPLLPIATGFENEQEVVAEENGQLYILSNMGAPNRRLVRLNAAKQVLTDGAEVIIPEQKFPLTVTYCGGKLFAQLLKDAVSSVTQYSLDGKAEGEIKLPGLGTATGFSGKKNDRTAYYTYTSYTSPAVVYGYDLITRVSSEWQRPKLAFDPADFESKQVFYESLDGTPVPMIISYKRGTNLSQPNPTMLYGYGGFSISLTPAFSPSVLSFMEAGGVYAVANLRGGGEYGDDWHNAGVQMKKMNVFDDFYAAAQYLIKQGITKKELLGISGGSNGGLLVGATITLHPDLCAVAFPAVGVLDMLRYHKFTAGAGWAYDYGTADDSMQMFTYLYHYSPVHNVRAGNCYPATLVMTGDHDDRVVPAHSFKFAAALQAAQSCANPTLIRIETRAGHGAGKPTSMLIDEQADKWAFFYKSTGAVYNPQK